jgi:hypothetical protein
LTVLRSPGCSSPLAQRPSPFLPPTPTRPPRPRQLNNFSAAPQELSLTVQEASGFVFSGDKAQTLALPARGEGRVTWHLVAHGGGGELPLPSVRVAAPRLGASVATQSSLIHVMPF